MFLIRFVLTTTTNETFHDTCDIEHVAVPFFGEGIWIGGVEYRVSDVVHVPGKHEHDEPVAQVYAERKV